MSKQKIYSETTYEGEGDTVLEALRNARVLKVSRFADGLRFEENCDNYFAAVLTFKQVRQFIAELNELMP